MNDQRLKLSIKLGNNQRDSHLASVHSDDKPVPFESFESKPGCFLKILSKRKQEGEGANSNE
jgi:hypothetical protein